MDLNDQWGRDPNVQIMRRVFSRMETAHRRLLEQLGIPSHDMRLKNWRRQARALFEKAWSEASGRGIPVGEERAPVIYLYCLAGRMARDGLDVPAHMLPRDPEIERVVREVSP